MPLQVKYYKTPFLLDEFNEDYSLFQVRKIADGIGVYYSYSNDFPQVIQYLPPCDDYNSIVLSVYKVIDPVYSLLVNPSKKHFLNVMIFVEKPYIVNLLGGNMPISGSNIDENVFFQKKWLEISAEWLLNLEINLFSTKIPNSYIDAWVHQYLYEMAHESYKMFFPSPTTNFKQEDILKVRKLEIIIKNTPFKAIPSINEMADDVGMSPTKFKKVFREAFGRSTHQYILEIKAEQAKLLLETNKLSIIQVAYKVGFNHPSGLTRLIKNKYKVSPLKISAFSPMGV